jgi:hypothetical protein
MKGLQNVLKMIKRPSIWAGERMHSRSILGRHREAIIVDTSPLIGALRRRLKREPTRGKCSQPKEKEANQKKR